MLLLLLLPIAVLIWRSRRGRTAALALALRLGILALVVLALADPVLAQKTMAHGALVVLADQSASLGDQGRAALLARAQAIMRRDGAAYDSAHLLLFGKNQAAESDQVDADASDLAAALRAAGGLIGGGQGRVVLLSDGGQTQGDALAEARSLGARGIAVDTAAYTTPAAAEVWVSALDIPATLRQGEEFDAVVTVSSTGQADGEIQLSEGETVLAAQQIALTGGEQRVSFTTRATAQGVMRLTAQVTAQPDAEPRNNSASATALVAAPPNVLLVEGVGGGAAPLRVGLRSAGVQTQVIQARSLPAQMDVLDQFDGVVLVDVSAGEMTLDQMAALREFVRSEGRGLVATGGRASFTLGAYKGTPLEEVLPVQMDPPPRPKRADVAMLLVIDRSASMGGAAPSKFDMAKEAAMLATDSLRDEDRIGVLTFDTGVSWTVPFQQIGTGLSVAQIQEEIGTLAMGGGTDILAALQESLPQLAAQPSTVRHAVLLTDGRSFTDEYPLYQQLVAQARTMDITLSTIAIGSDADTELLQLLASWGAGRYYFAASADDIPRLTLMESEIARAEPQVEGDFRATQIAPHPLLRDFPAFRLPQLGGYVATTLKPQAELVLKSPEDDPVLAVWQYGLGRAVAWTPSVETPWAPNWSNWDEYGRFWADIIRYTLPDADSGLTQARATASAQGVVISVDSLNPGGSTFDLADTQAAITMPDGTLHRVTLRQVAPGRYAETVGLPSDGAYAVDITQLKDGEQRAVSIGYVQPYPAEYLPVAGGDALLGQISAASGGGRLADAAGAASPAAADDSPEPLGLAPWLLLAAALLWPVEIAERRGWLRRVTR